MKDFFKNKLNIVLSILLVAVIGLAIYFVLNLTGISLSHKVEAIDFTGYSKAQVEKWVSENKIKDGVYSYSYEYSDDIDKDYVVYQSVKAGEEIKDALVFIYSNGKDPSGELDLPSVTNGTTEEEIESWLNLNEFTNVTYVYETSDTHEFGTVISISPSKAKKNDAVTVTVSLGSDIEEIETEVPDFSTYTKDQIVRWGNRYGITLKIDYETHDQAKEDEFISQSVAKGTKINGGDSLIVTLSSGQSDGSEATIPATLLGESEETFKTKLKELGFTNLSKSSTTYYAESLEKDSIYSYDDGTFPTSKTINYALCAGKYTFDASELNGQTKTKAQSIVDSYRNRNARVNKTLISISFETGDVSAERANEVYGCAIDGAKISCKVYSNGETATIPTDSRYLGKSEADYLAAMKELGYTNFDKEDTTYYSTKLAKDTIYSYDDGEIALAKTLNYALSAGAYSFNASDFNGLTQTGAEAAVEMMQKRNARVNGTLVSIKFTDGDSSGTKGNTYGCAISGSVISCKVYGGSSSSTTTGETVTIPTDGRYLGYSEANYLSAMKALGFTSFNKSSTTYYSTTLSSGTVYSYDDGSFSTSTALNYALSCGKYTFNASDYNGKTQSAVQSLVSDQTNRNARVSGSKISVKFSNGTSGGTAGNTYDCSMSGSVISCKLYTSGGSTPTTTTVNVSNFTNQSLSNLQSWASSNGLSVSVSYQYSDTVDSGIIISQSPNSSTVNKGSTISAVVSQGKKPSSNVYIMASNLIIDKCSNSSLSTAKSNVTSYFSSFSKVTINEVTAREDVGTVISISVNGNTNYTPGEYPTDSTVIVVEICSNTSN